MHIHSSASFDCQVPPRLVLGRCNALGLAPIFLTDHDTIQGGRGLRVEGSPDVLLGQEITTAEGEIIGLFLDREVPSGLPPTEAVRRIKEQGGLVYLQHPFDASRRCLTERAVDSIAGEVDIVEVFNGRSDDGANFRARDLCTALGAAAGAGSDAHSLAEIGKCYVAMRPFVGPLSFLASLRSARIVRHPNRWALRAEAWMARRRTRSGQRPGALPW